MFFSLKPPTEGWPIVIHCMSMRPKSSLRHRTRPRLGVSDLVSSNHEPTIAINHSRKLIKKKKKTNFWNWFQQVSFKPGSNNNDFQGVLPRSKQLMVGSSGENLAHCSGIFGPRPLCSVTSLNRPICVKFGLKKDPPHSFRCLISLFKCVFNHKKQHLLPLLTKQNSIPKKSKVDLKQTWSKKKT